MHMTLLHVFFLRVFFDFLKNYVYHIVNKIVLLSHSLLNMFLVSMGKVYVKGLLVWI